MSDFCIDFGSPPVLRDGCNCSGGKVNLGCTDGIGLLLVGSVDVGRGGLCLDLTGALNGRLLC